MSKKLILFKSTHETIGYAGGFSLFYDNRHKDIFFNSARERSEHQSINGKFRHYQGVLVTSKVWDLLDDSGHLTYLSGWWGALLPNHAHELDL